MTHAARHRPCGRSKSRPDLMFLALICFLAAAAPAVAQTASRPEIRITSWASNNATAYGLAFAMLDPNAFTLVNASYSGDRQAAGYANFTFGTQDWFDVLGAEPDAFTTWGFQPPHHFTFWRGPIMATARIDGAPLTSSLAKVTSLASGAPTGAIRAVKLTMFVRAKFAGNLRTYWGFGDAAHPTAKAAYNGSASSNNTIRIKVDGVHRALTRQNRFVSINSLYKRVSSTNSTLLGNEAGIRRRLDMPGSEILGVEFGGVEYSSIYSTYPVLVAINQTVKIEFIVADLNNFGPTVFYPNLVWIEGLRKCTSNATCIGMTSASYCCGGFCCVNDRKCCGGRECCNTPNSICVQPTPGSPSACCTPQAACSADGGKTYFCCPLGQQCIGNGVCRA